jgi:hypothetical protein
MRLSALAALRRDREQLSLLSRMENNFSSFGILLFSSKGTATTVDQNSSKSELQYSTLLLQCTVLQQNYINCGIILCTKL